MRFGLENEAKTRPKTNISVDVAKKKRKTPEIHAYKRHRGVGRLGRAAPQGEAMSNHVANLSDRDSWFEGVYIHKK